MNTLIDEVLGNNSERNESFLFHDLNDVEKFRVTGIQSAETCGRYWRTNFLHGESDPEKERGNVWTRVGTLIHLLAESFILEFMTGKPRLTRQDEQDIMTAIHELGDPQTYLNWLTYRNRLMMYIMGGQLVGVELNAKIPNQIVQLEGQIDLLFYDTKGNLTLLDHKTNRRPVENHKWSPKFQINAYATYVCNKYNVDRVRFIIGNVNLEKDNDFFVTGSVANLNVRINHAMENIKLNKEGVGDNCYSCGVKEQCKTHKTYLKLMGK